MLMHSKYKMLNTILGSPLPPVVCSRAHVLFTLCLFAYRGVQHILCCVFVLLRLLYNLLPVFPNYPFLIAPSGFSNNYEWYSLNFFLNTVVFVKVRCSSYTFLHIFDYNENLKPLHQQLYQILKLLQTKINKFQSYSSMWENTTLIINKYNSIDKQQ